MRQLCDVRERDGDVMTLKRPAVKISNMRRRTNEGLKTHLYLLHRVHSPTQRFSRIFVTNSYFSRPTASKCARRSGDTSFVLSARTDGRGRPRGRDSRALAIIASARLPPAPPLPATACYTDLRLICDSLDTLFALYAASRRHRHILR